MIEFFTNKMIELLKARGLKTMYVKSFPESWKKLRYEPDDMIMYKEEDLKSPQTGFYLRMTVKAAKLVQKIYNDNVTVSHLDGQDGKVKVTGLKKDQLKLLGIGLGDRLHMTSQEFDAFMEKGTVPQGRVKAIEMRQKLLS